MTNAWLAPFAGALLLFPAATAATRTGPGASAVHCPDEGCRELLRHLSGIPAGPAFTVLGELRSFAPRDGRLLYDLVTAANLRRGLQIGTAQGNSTVWLGLAFQRTDGRLVTLERDPARLGAASTHLRRSGLEHVVECRVADPFTEIPRLAGEYDFVYFDLPVPQHRALFDLVYSRLASGGVLAAHGANVFEAAMPDFYRAITAAPGLETHILPSSTGGFSISRKR